MAVAPHRQAFPEKQPSLVRRPVARKAVGGVSSQTDHHINAIELSASNEQRAHPQPTNIPCELPASPVVAASTSKQARSSTEFGAAHSTSSSPHLDSSIGSLPSPTAPALGIIDTATNGPIKPGGGLARCFELGTVAEGGNQMSIPGTVQPSANQTRRMRRRELLESMTGNVGTSQGPNMTQSPPASHAQPAFASPATTQFGSAESRRLSSQVQAVAQSEYISQAPAPAQPQYLASAQLPTTPASPAPHSRPGSASTARYSSEGPPLSEAQYRASMPTFPPATPSGSHLNLGASLQMGYPLQNQAQVQGHYPALNLPNHHAPFVGSSFQSVTASRLSDVPLAYSATQPQYFLPIQPSAPTNPSVPPGLSVQHFAPPSLQPWSSTQTQGIASPYQFSPPTIPLAASAQIVSSTIGDQIPLRDGQDMASRPVELPTVSNGNQEQGAPSTPPPINTTPVVAHARLSKSAQDAQMLSSVASLPMAPNHGSSVVSSLADLTSPVKRRPTARQSMIIQSAQTVLSATNHRSSPNNASSTSSPITNVATPAPLTRPLSQPLEAVRSSSAGELDGSAAYISLCSFCRTGLTPATSFFECLICASANLKVCFCIYCYTTGAAAGGHPHEPSFYVSATDPLAPDGAILSGRWTARKNAMSRIWYQHTASGYKTYVRPKPDLFNTLPSGWEELRNPEGRAYYLEASSGKTSWDRPNKKLPLGWTEVKTPEGKPFYVHEELQLSTWDLPGQAPDPKKALQVGSPSKSPKATQWNPQPIRQESPSTATNAMSFVASSRKASTVISGMGMAAKFSSSASDLASDPIMGTTRAVTKGVMYAAKSLTNNKQTRRMFSKVGMKNMKQIAEAAINVVGDGDDNEFNEVGDDTVNDGQASDGNDEEITLTPTKEGGDENDAVLDNGGYGSDQQNNISVGPAAELQQPTMFIDPGIMQQGTGMNSCGLDSDAKNTNQLSPTPVDPNFTIVENSLANSNSVDRSVENQPTSHCSHDYVDQCVDNQNVDRSTQHNVVQIAKDQYADESSHKHVDQSFDAQFMDQSTIYQSNEKSGQSWANSSQSTMNIHVSVQQSNYSDPDISNMQKSVVWNEGTNTQNTSLLDPPATSAPSMTDAVKVPPQPAASPYSADRLPSDVGQPAIVEQHEQQPPAPSVFDPSFAAAVIAEAPANLTDPNFAPQYPYFSINEASSDALALI